MMECSSVKNFCLQVFMLIVLGHTQERTEGRMTYLPGSCIAAGYTSCCTTATSSNNCAGEPATCFCDPSCNEFGDCCEDLQQICNPEWDATLESLHPVFTFVTNTTFHTASLLWVIAPYKQSIQINGTYEILLRKAIERDGFNSSLEVSQNVSTGLAANNRVYNVHWSHLEEDVTYTYGIGIMSNVGAAESVAEGHFRTLRYPSVDNVHLKTLTEHSSVEVSWLPPTLPMGVSISHYKVYYEEQHERRNQSVFIKTFSAKSTHGTIHQLHSHQLYVFSLSVLVQELDGILYEINLTMALEDADLQIFIPSSSFFQLVASSSLQCKDWNLQFEEAVVNAFHSTTIDIINKLCHCDYPSRNIRHKILLCTEDGNLAQATYRAELLSTVDYTTNQILSFIERWRVTGHVIQVIGKGREKYSNLVIKNCSTSIDSKSAPLCTSETRHSPRSVSLSVFVITLLASLFVEFFVLTLCGVAVFTFLIRRKLCKKEAIDHSVKNLTHSDSAGLNTSSHDCIRNIYPLQSTEQGSIKYL